MALRLPSTGGTSSPDTFSTGEVLTNKVWTNGKAVYRKVVDLGALPNATTKSVPHGITGATAFVSVKGGATGGGASTALPHSSPAGINFGIGMSVSGANVDVVTGTDRTTWTGFAVLEYTK